MLLGTWGAAYFTYWYGPWAGLVGAAALGALGGLLHALATVTFGVDHIVSGVAINIIALGATQFLAEAVLPRPGQRRSAPAHRSRPVALRHRAGTVRTG